MEQDKITTARRDVLAAENKYRQQKAEKKSKKTEAEPLAQRYVAPLLLLLTLLISWLVRLIFGTN